MVVLQTVPPLCTTLAGLDGMTPVPDRHAFRSRSPLDEIAFFEPFDRTRLSQARFSTPSESVVPGRFKSDQRGGGYLALGDPADDEN